MKGSQDLKQFLQGNSVHAYNLETGKFRWRLGGYLSYYVALPEKRGFKNGRRISCGAPLPLDRQVAILNEKNNGELRLVWVDPRTLHGPTQSAENALLGVTQASRRYLIDVVGGSVPLTLPRHKVYSFARSTRARCSALTLFQAESSGPILITAKRPILVRASQQVLELTGKPPPRSFTATRSFSRHRRKARFTA